MKHNKALGKDEISIEALKIGGQRLLNSLKLLCDEFILTVDYWNNAIIALIHKKGGIWNVENYWSTI